MYQKIIWLVTVLLFSTASSAHQDDKDEYGFHVELCKNCTTEADFMYTAQLQIDVDSGGGQMLNKTVVVGNLGSKVLKAYRVSKVIDQGYSQTTVTPIATPSAVTESFQAAEAFFVAFEAQNGQQIDRYNPELSITIDPTIDGIDTSSYYVIRANIQSAGAVSNLLRMRLLGTMSQALQKKVILWLRAAELVVETKFSDGTSVAWRFANPLESLQPFRMIEGTEAQNGVPIAPPASYQSNTMSLGYYMSPASLGTVVLKCRPYTIKSSSGEVFTGTICWYQRP